MCARSGSRLLTLPSIITSRRDVAESPAASRQLPAAPLQLPIEHTAIFAAFGSGITTAVRLLAAVMLSQSSASWVAKAPFILAEGLALAFAAPLFSTFFQAREANCGRGRRPEWCRHTFIAY